MPNFAEEVADLTDSQIRFVLSWLAGVIEARGHAMPGDLRMAIEEASRQA